MPLKLNAQNNNTKKIVHIEKLYELLNNISSK